MYLERVKKADAAITGKEAEEILDDQIICESNAKMFLSSAKSVNADKEYCCHSCLCDCERLCGNRVILKELYSTSVEYSTNLLDTIQLDGAEYRIYVFLVK